MSFNDHQDSKVDIDTLFGNVGFGIDHRQTPSEPTASVGGDTVGPRVRR